MSKSKTRKIAEKTIFATFNILKDNDGEMRGQEVVKKIRNTISFDEYEAHRYESGLIRWETIMSFYTTFCIKAGFIRKQKGTWYLTQEGESAIDLGAEKLLDIAEKSYKEWDAKQRSKDDIQYLKDTKDENILEIQKPSISRYEEEAYNGIRDFIISKSPYEFQDLVAELLKVMGYFISEVAQRGPDGGIDIVAYTDPLGTKQPRIIVQVKHRPHDHISSDDIQKLAGTLKRNTDVGIFITSGLFSKPAKKEAREYRSHIELIDFERFVSLWQEYYPRMSDEQKSFLPLHPIYFLSE